MIIQSVWQESFESFGKPVVIQPTQAELTSDAGLLPIREFDRRIGLTDKLLSRFIDNVENALLCYSMFGKLLSTEFFNAQLFQFEACFNNAINKPLL